MTLHAVPAPLSAFIAAILDAHVYGSTYRLTRDFPLFSAGGWILN